MGHPVGAKAAFPLISLFKGNKNACFEASYHYYRKNCNMPLEKYRFRQTRRWQIREVLGKLGNLSRN
jgi:hypothetical protein